MNVGVDEHFSSILPSLTTCLVCSKLSVGGEDCCLLVGRCKARFPILNRDFFVVGVLFSSPSLSRFQNNFSGKAGYALNFSLMFKPFFGPIGMMVESSASSAPFLFLISNISTNQRRQRMEFQ